MVEPIVFAEWLAERDYVLIHIDASGYRLWENGKYKKTTKQLYKDFKNDISKHK